jgi:hypothetical protein
MTKSQPWYIQYGLYLAIIILAIVLVKVAIIDPKNAVETQEYYKTETHLRMKNLKEGEILWQLKYGKFTANLDSLVSFIKTDPMVDSIKNAFDTLTQKSANPFVPLSTGQFTPESLYFSPRTHQRFLVSVDTAVSADTVVNRRGQITRIDTTTTMGNLYMIEDPDGNGTIGSTTDEALKNTASWE